MAIEEYDREDLLRDGKTMPLRGEVTINGENVIVGFRRDGQMSLYCGADPVFQFNAEHQMRRVYFQSQRYAAENGKLVHLVRELKGGRITFQRRAVSPDQWLEIRSALLTWIDRIRKVMNAGSSTWRLSTGQLMAETEHEFTRRLRDVLSKMNRPPKIADSANA